MKKLLTLIGVAALLLATSGCKNPAVGPAVMRQGVAAGVAYSVIKYPEAVPYVRAAGSVICSQANGTDLSPGGIVAAVEASNANALKTPEGVLIVNSALGLYTLVWNSYGADALNNAPTFKLYLQATCDGINDGLIGARSTTAGNWPQVRMP